MFLLLSLVAFFSFCEGLQNLHRGAPIFGGAEPATIFAPDEIAEMRSDFHQRGQLLQQLAEGSNQTMLVNIDGLRKKVVHLHFHNCAGTWMCENAKMAGEKTTPAPHNCNMYWADEFHEDPSMDGPHLNVPQHGYPNMTCRERLNEMEIEGHGISFSCIERWLDHDRGDWCPEDLAYTTILRDPFERMGTTMVMDYNSSESRVLDALHTGSTEMPQARRWLSSHVPFDNFMVRSLNGPEVFRLPAGKITAEHLEEAKKRLDKFDVVMAVPTLSTDMVQLTEIIGWPAWIIHAQKDVHTRYGNQNHHRVPPFSAEFLSTLKKLNRHEMELYHFGVELARKRTEKHLSRLKAQRAQLDHQ